MSALKQRRLFLVAVALALVACGGEESDASWPQWRGPGGLGISSAADLPFHWNKDGSGIKWSAPIDGAGTSSPIAVGGRVYVTSAKRIGSQVELRVHGFDLGNGESLWQTTVARRQRERTHRMNSSAGSTPVSDGQTTFAYFGSHLAALDSAGQTVWVNEIDPDYLKNARYAAGSSLVLAGDLVIVLRDRERVAEDQVGWIAAYDKTSGEQVWKKHWDDSCCSYTTPLVFNHRAGQQIVRWSTGEVLGYAADSGRRLWSLETGTLQPVPSPVVAGNLLCNSAGVLGRETLCAALSDDGASSPDVVWRIPAKAPRIPSGVLYQGLLFTVTDLAVMTAFDAATGRSVWARRLKGGRFSASLLAADGRIYATSERGLTTVVAAKRKFELLAENHVGEEVRGSPAAAGGCLLVRTRQHLYCIERRRLQ